MSLDGLGYADRPDRELVTLREQRLRLMNEIQEARARRRNDAEKVRLRAEIEELRATLEREKAPATDAPVPPIPLVLPGARLEIVTGLQARREL